MDEQSLRANRAGSGLKILLFGANGQVGWELQRSLCPLGEVFVLDRHSTQWCGDLSDLAGITNSVANIRPDIIVNAAAYTAVDRAEDDVQNARLINVLAPEALAIAAKAVDAWLVHYSTDYVFDGSGSHPWSETDATGPLSVYGRTKLEGEGRIAKHCTKHLIFRTSWVYAARGANFANTMIRLFRERESLNIISDQFGAPTGADLVADVTSHVLKQIGTDQTLSGIYHLAAAGETTWFDYAKYLLAEVARQKVAPKSIVRNINAVSTRAFPVKAIRPQNSRLNTSKIQHSFGLRLPPWQLGINRMMVESHLSRP